MKKRMKRRRIGFTLIEMTCVMACLTVLMLAGVGLIVLTLKTGRMGEATADRLILRDTLAKQFREDVASAESAPDKLGDLVSGPTLLILRMPDGTTIIYRIEEDGCERIEQKGDLETSRRLTLGSKNSKSEFLKPPAGSKLITLRIEDASGRGPSKVNELSSALGGNSR